MSNSVISTERLGKRYGRRWAVENLTMNMPRGAVMAFLGPNGAGKTTTIRMLQNLVRPDRGSGTVLGLDITRSGPDIRRLIGYVPERPHMIDWMTIDRIQAFTASFYPTWDGAYARELTTRFNLRPESKIKSLSRGEEAKLALLLALAHRPELLILDDATAGIDPGARREILETVIAHMHQEGTSIFFATHLVHEVEGLVTIVAVFNQGHLTRQAPIDELKRSIRRIQFRSDAEIPSPPAGIDILMRKRIGAIEDLVVECPALETIESFANANHTTADEVSLEDIYLALTAPGRGTS